MRGQDQFWLETLTSAEFLQVKDGECRACTISPSMDGDPSHKNIISQVYWDASGRASVYVINYSDKVATGHIILPAEVLVGQGAGFPIPSTHNMASKNKIGPLSEVEGEQVGIDLGRPDMCPGPSTIDPRPWSQI